MGWSYSDEMVGTPSDSTEDEYDVAQETTSDQEVNDLLTEAEVRLKKASYYKQIIDAQIFQPPDEISREIEGEFKIWAREQMMILVGLKQKETAAPAPAALPFSSDQIVVLKSIADNVLSDSKLRQKVVQEPAKPKIQVQAPPRPTVVAAVKTTAPPKVEARPAVAPQVPQAAKQKPGPKKQAIKTADEVKGLPADGELVKERDRVYKYTRKVVDDASEIPRGTKVHNENGVYFYIIRKDVTDSRVVRDPTAKPIPMPMGEDLTRATEIVAMEAESNAPKDMSVESLGAISGLAGHGSSGVHIG